MELSIYYSIEDVSLIFIFSFSFGNKSIENYFRVHLTQYTNCIRDVRLGWNIIIYCIFKTKLGLLIVPRKVSWFTLYSQNTSTSTSTSTWNKNAWETKTDGIWYTITVANQSRLHMLTKAYYKSTLTKAYKVLQKQSVCVNRSRTSTSSVLSFGEAIVLGFICACLVWLRYSCRLVICRGICYFGATRLTVSAWQKRNKLGCVFCLVLVLNYPIFVILYSL